LGERLGLLGAETSARARVKTIAVQSETERLKKSRVPPSNEVNDLLASLGSAPIRTAVSAFELLRRPEIPYLELLRMAGLPTMLEIDQAAELETEVKYEGYVRRQSDTGERSKRLENTAIPGWFDFGSVGGLSTEVRESLSQVRPCTLAQAARMPGITPAAVELLAIHIRSRGNPKNLAG